MYSSTFVSNSTDALQIGSTVSQYILLDAEGKLPHYGSEEIKGVIARKVVSSEVNGETFEVWVDEDQLVPLEERLTSGGTVARRQWEYELVERIPVAQVPVGTFDLGTISAPSTTTFVTEHSLSQAEAEVFADYDVYWLGTAFEAIPLHQFMHIEAGGDGYASLGAEVDDFSITYGLGGSGGTFPVQLLVTPISAYHETTLVSGDPEVIVHNGETVTVNTIGELLVQRGTVVIKIMAGNKNRALRALDALIQLN